MIVPAATGGLLNDNPNGNPQIESVVVTQPAHGTLSLGGDGALTYTPSANYNGPDSFTYRARNYVGPIAFDIDPALSNFTLSATLHASILTQTRSDTSRMDGTVTVGTLEPKTTGPFNLIQITGINGVLIDPLDLHYNIIIVGTIDITAAPNALSL